MQNAPLSHAANKRQNNNDFVFLLRYVEMIPSILCPGFFIVTRIEGTFLSVAYGAQSILGNTEVNEVFHGAGSTSLAESHVVFYRSALVTISLDEDIEFKMCLKPLGMHIQNLTRVRPEVGAVKGKVDVGKLGCFFVSARRSQS